MRAKEFLNEINMSPNKLRKLAGSIDATVGIEFEMIVPVVETAPVEDFSDEHPLESIDDIIAFFQTNEEGDEINSEKDIKAQLYKIVINHSIEEISKNFIQSPGKEFLPQYLKDNISPVHIIEMLDIQNDLFGEKILSKQDYIDAADMIIQQYISGDRTWRWLRDSARNAFLYFYASHLAEEDVEKYSGCSTMKEFWEETDRGYIEWPVMDKGMSIATIADMFGDYIGKQTTYGDEYHSAERIDNYYAVEPDTSIRPDDGGTGLEFISPPMSLSEMQEDLLKVWDFAENNDCYTNDSTGLHINVSIPGYSLENLDYVKLALLLGDEYVLDIFGRMGNEYCQSSLKIIQDRASTTDQASSVLIQLQKNINKLASKAIHSGSTEKYVSINTHDDYVEFRSVGGDWLGENPEIITDVIVRFIVALDSALSPEKDRKEYLKALYKVLNPKTATDNSSYFAQFMAGNISKTQCAKAIVDSRNTRKTKETRGVGIKQIKETEAGQYDWKITHTNNDGTIESIYLKNTIDMETPDVVIGAIKVIKPDWLRGSNYRNTVIAQVKDSDDHPNNAVLRTFNVINYVTGRSEIVRAKDEDDALKVVRQHFGANDWDDDDTSVRLIRRA